MGNCRQLQVTAESTCGKLLGTPMGNSQKLTFLVADNNQWPESSTSVDSQQDRVLAVTSNIALSDNLPIKALARHPLKVGWVLAATSTALLEISEVGNCWMVSGHVDLNSSACESDGAASHHTLFQEIIYVYPVAEETFSGNLGSSSVLIADSQQHCIYHIDLSTTVTEEFIGNCGSDKITAEFESKNQMDYELRSPLSIRPVRINSQTSLLVTTQYLTLGVTIISFSPGLSAYRSRILEDSVGYTSHPLYLCNAVSSTVNLETTSGQKICSLTQNRLGMLYEFQWECHRTKHMFTLDEESFFQVMDNKIYQLIPDFSSLAYVQKRIYVKNPEGEEVNVMSYGSFGSSVVGVYDQSVHQILLIAQQKEKIDTDTAATYTLSTDEIGCSNYVVYHSFPASAETCAYISYRHVGTGFIYDSTISRCYLVSYLSETYGEGIGSLANLSCYNDVSRV